MAVSIWIRNYDSLNRGERRKFGNDLVTARNGNPQLASELPLVYKGYESQKSARRRIKRIAKNAGEACLSANVIVESNFGIGGATAQINNKQPTNLPEYRGNAVELSYWHRRPLSYEATEIGEEVMSDLIAIANGVPFNAGLLWTVTLPRDAVKHQVCKSLDFEQVQTSQLYAIGDESTVARQLWVRNA